MVGLRLTPKLREKIVGRLLEHDPNIVEIIQFGSSVYAPKHAKDIDLMIFTKERRGKSTDYMDKLYDLNLPYDIDVLVEEAGERLKPHLATSVRGAYRILHGDGGYLKGATMHVDPTFKEAYATLELARRYLRDAKAEDQALLRNGHVRDAFDKLFDAARIASMTYLATEDTRWGRMKGRLPTNYRKAFDQFVDRRHIDYFYHGNYPKDYQGEFEKWYGKVEQYINQLKKKVKNLHNPKPRKTT